VTVDAANLVLVTAAASLAGPAASVESITARAVDLALLAAPDSPVMATVDRVLAASRFVAVIRGVAVEDSSTRGLVKLETRKGDEVDTETIRTERTDGPEGRAMVDRLRPLIGHRVLVFKEVEDGGRDRKYRLLVHVVDLGHEDGTPAPAPAPPSGPGPAPGDDAPTNARELVVAAGERFALTEADVKAVALEFLGDAPAGGRTPDDVARLWTEIQRRWTPLRPGDEIPVDQEVRY